MSKINEMQGVPSHLETLHRSENDERRYKTKCEYYLNGNCKYYKRKCTGSAHCDDYKVKESVKGILGDFDVVKSHVCLYGPFVKEYDEEFLTPEELKFRIELVPGTVIYNKKLKENGEVIKLDIIKDAISINYDKSGIKNYKLAKFVKQNFVNENVYIVYKGNN